MTKFEPVSSCDTGAGHADFHLHCRGHSCVLAKLVLHPVPWRMLMQVRMFLVFVRIPKCSFSIVVSGDAHTFADPFPDPCDRPASFHCFGHGARQSEQGKRWEHDGKTMENAGTSMGSPFVSLSTLSLSLTLTFTFLKLSSKVDLTPAILPAEACYRIEKPWFDLWHFDLWPRSQPCTGEANILKMRPRPKDSADNFQISVMMRHVSSWQLLPLSRKSLSCWCGALARKIRLKLFYRFLQVSGLSSGVIWCDLPTSIAWTEDVVGNDHERCCAHSQALSGHICIRETRISS